MFAYYSTYMLEDDYLYLYHYVPWDENEVVTTILEKLDWETATDTDATWRIDDATAAFYNLVYLVMAGFTEFDNFRSYQIREGKMTRDHAMKLIEKENKPRIEMIEWYTNTIGLDCNWAIERIINATRLYL
jgi:hypothetical protein